MAGNRSRAIPGRKLLLCVLLVSNVLLVYSNHFQNDFHFDDLTAVPGNPAIRDLRTIWRSVIDATLFSSAPQQRNYRPVTTASLTLDYWLAGGFNSFFFHLSTFIWFSALLVLLFFLFRWIMDRADPHPSNEWTALAAAAVFGFHPANAETVNYVIQRADLYNTLGCVAALWLFIRYPSQRKYFWYLIPALLAMLSKPPALVFPLLLASYVFLFEHEGEPVGRSWQGALRATLPALAVTAAVGWLLRHMQPPTWSSGALSPFLYRIGQPFVALHYFKSFFLPTDLNVDPGWHYIAPLSVQAVAGYVFVLVLLTVAVAAWFIRSGRPVTFGIIWFFVALLPTSIVPLADLTNDHRMFFPFVGLTLAIMWTLRQVLFRFTARMTRRDGWLCATVLALSMVLAVAALATRVRNRVWLTEESLWRDATLKNPQYARAWSNYGAAFFRQGDYQSAYLNWKRAAMLDPACIVCEENMVRVCLKLHRDELAEPHFQQLLKMHPPVPTPYIDYAGWLASTGRFEESVRILDRAARLYPHSVELCRAHRKLFLERDAGARSPIFQALDTDADTVLSAGEILAAPETLWILDKNSDGELSAEECGANFGDESKLSAAFLRNARRQFMQSNPLLQALDSNYDGEISAREISEAGRNLLALDRNGDGALQTSEIVPQPVSQAAGRLMAMLDLNHDGRMEANEWQGEAGSSLHKLLSAADVDGDGEITLEELTDEIYYEADRSEDGQRAMRTVSQLGPSGVAGIPAPTAKAQ